MLPAAQLNMLPLAQLVLLKQAVDAASAQWEREQAERRRREAEERARQEAIEVEKSRRAKPKQAKNPPPVFPFFWWERLSGASVHMNGRIYDPLLGRMLSADPHIQSPSNLQNYNRYSYVTNNPLSMTDPSGFFFKKLFKSIKKFFKKFWRPILAIGLAVLTGGIAAGLWLGVQGVGAFALAQGLVLGHFGAALGFAGSVFVGAVGGFVGGLVTGGLRGGLLGALTGGVAGGIGFAFSDAGKFANLKFKELARASAHGVTGGTVSELAGGEFGAGFAGSFVGSVVAHAGPQWDNSFAQVAQSAVAGGTVSELSGGKFENGAVTAAFQVMFNKGVHESQSEGKWFDWRGTIEEFKFMGSILGDYADGSQFMRDFRTELNMWKSDGWSRFSELSLGLGVPSATAGSSSASWFAGRSALGPNGFVTGRGGLLQVANGRYFRFGYSGSVNGYANPQWRIAIGNASSRIHLHINRTNVFKPWNWGEATRKATEAAARNIN